jgi:hypothetical protein
MNPSDCHLSVAAYKAASQAESALQRRMSRIVRVLSGAAATGLLATLVGCATTQASLPTVDDTQRRPVNSAAALELLTCRAEAQALRLNLNLIDPALATRGGACSGLPAPAPNTKPDADPKTRSGSSRAVFEFEAGKTELVLDDATRQVLRRTAQNADVVLVHAAGQVGATAIGSEVNAQALATAQATAHATAQALVKAGIEPPKLRISWSVAGAAEPASTAATRGASVVEVEFVERGTRLLFSKPADTASPPAPATPATPTIASLDRLGKSN